MNKINSWDATKAFTISLVITSTEQEEVSISVREDEKFIAEIWKLSPEGDPIWCTFQSTSVDFARAKRALLKALQSGDYDADTKEAIEHSVPVTFKDRYAYISDVRAKKIYLA